MFLEELDVWLKKEMKEKGIPGDARIDWIDVGHVSPEFWEMNYDPETNTVTISQV